MKLCIVFLFPLLAVAEEDAVATGASLFRTSCSVAYCHGAAGTAGRAPRLAGRSFTKDRLVEIIRGGIPKTAMPGFKNQMSEEKIDAIALYVLSLSGPAIAEPTKALHRELPPAAKMGRALFFDATRMGGCGTCHLVDGWGVSVGPALDKNLPADAGALRAFRSARVQRAESPNEEPFPVLSVAASRSTVTLYDLSTALPVLRTFPTKEIRLTPNAAWNHADVLRQFNDTELNSILGFLRELR